MSIVLTEVVGLITVQGAPQAERLKFGVPFGGAFDQASLQLANRIVGNDPEAPALELAMARCVIQAQADVLLALAGAPSAALGSKVARPGEPIWLHAGESIAVNAPTTGVLTYLAVRGGLAAPRLTRPIGPGTILEIQHAISGEPTTARAPSASLTPAAIEVMLGPQSGMFNVATFFSQRYEVTRQINRQGLRLSGFALTGHQEIASEPCVPGAIQVTRDGQLLIIGPDGPTIGGYPKIAVITRRSLDRVAQVRPGERLTFKVAR